ncbi:DNA-binding response regulator [Nitratireductor luteus]|uniref:response regulator transcription factor n=1 Tax=Nitratireductor luteus TaxID=2976980 RepID=UPI00223FCAA3|nr:DNA-binding response regulator [Nitratireductor luteus]
MDDREPAGEIVLVVDDSPETLGFLTTAMEQAGVTVLVATSGEAALNIVDKISPDVILMDAVMPGLDGFETCRRLKGHTTAAHIPVIFMTGLTQTEHVVHALDSGGVDYLTKPINLEELRARMRVHLVNARRAQSTRLALDAAGRHLLALSAAGNILWSTPQTSRLLEAPEAGPDAPEAIVQAAAQWMAAHAGTPPLGKSLDIPVSGTRRFELVCLGQIGQDEFLFRLLSKGEDRQDEVLRRHFALTHRESEVLMWVARGKTNRDIAEILDLSPRTVTKHLEQVYVKLGVENRASAAVKAVSALAAM